MKIKPGIHDAQTSNSSQPIVPLFTVQMPPKEELLPELERVLYSGYIGQGPKVEEFEQRLAYQFIGNRNVLTVNSGTAAIQLALRLAGVKGGSVVTTPMTCTATNMPILAEGARIIWADVDPESGNVDPLDVERKIAPDTKAILCVHWGGTPCDMGELNRIGRKYGIPVIEDAAHALGAEWAYHKVGDGTADYSCFSGTTRIVTEQGNVPIKDVRVGDRVLTRSGSWERVAATQKRDYKGRWVALKAGQTRIAATADHPVLVHRHGGDEWIPAESVRRGDEVYCATRPCTRCESVPIPFYNQMCPTCYGSANRSLGKREKVQKARTGQGRASSRLIHHNRIVAPVMEEYRARGDRVIPLIAALPDFLVIRDGKVIAVEVESGTSVRLGKQGKYAGLNGDDYDDIVWHTRDVAKESFGRYSYTIEGGLARVPVSSVEYHDKARRRPVYNLTVENDPTYFARGILVHNCFSFQAIKHITTVDGGALAVRSTEQYRRGKLLRWYGIDRESERKDFRCEEDIEEWGYKFHMNDVAATIGLVQLNHLAGVLNRQRSHAAFYDKVFEGKLQRQRQHPRGRSSWWLYTLLLEDAPTRDAFMEHMKQEGVMVSRVHARNDTHTCFAAYRNGPLPGVEAFSARMCCIPVHHGLTEEDRQAVAGAALRFVAP